MMLQDPHELIRRAQGPVSTARTLGDVALGVTTAAVVVAAMVGAPKPVRSLALFSGAAIAACQWAASSDPRQQQVSQIAKSLRQHETRAVELQLQSQLATAEQQLRLESEMQILKQIAAAPKALQPVLLRQAGFEWLIPPVTGGVVKPPKKKVKKAAPNELPYTKDLAKDDDARYAWIDTVLNAPAVLVFGAQGSGKSTLAEYLVSKRLEADHDTEVLDPHLKYGAWDGLKTYGAGMDYRTLDCRLAEFEALTRDRYEQFSQVEHFNPKPKTIVCEEFTNWADRCLNSAEFFKASLSDNRKIRLHTLYISHGRTLAALGGAKGMAAARDRGLLEIELIGETGKDGKAQPSGRGRLRYPGSTDWQDVAIPDLTDFELKV